jgi:serine phosphatase RsbU (regulator of sigma subunit)/anti-sigma regulatory factor (Ser/Thr protein kinase)
LSRVDVTRQTLIPARVFALESVCEVGGVSEACRRARDCLAEAGLAGDELDAWELVLAEAGNNAVQHVRDDRRDRPFRVEFDVTAENAVARVFDHSDGFDFPEKAELPPPDSESGRGLFLIQNLTDEASYFRGRDENCLVLKKQRKAPGGIAEPAPIQASRIAELESTLELMTEELASSYESLSTIFRFTAELVEQPKPEEFARKWLGELVTTVKADWFTLRLAAENGRELRLVACSGDARAQEILSLENAGEADVSIEGRAACFRMDVWFDTLNPMAANDPLAALAGTGSGFAHPVVVDNILVGVLTVGRRKSDPAFEAGRVSIIQTFGDFLGIQFRNSHYREQRLRTRLMERELQIAAEIQRSLLPTTLPELPGFRLLGHYQSARQVGGDFYDAFITPDGGLLLAIADVMGKGVPAAMFAAIFRSQLRAGTARAESPGAVLAWMNRMMFADLDRVEMFITALLVHVDLGQRVVHLAAAGHPPFLLAGSGVPAWGVENSGMPLGVLPDAAYTERSVPLPPGANMLLFTDGLTEARDRDGKLMGLEGLEKCLTEAARRGQAPEQTKAALISLVAAHQNGEAANDDETFLLLTEIQSGQLRGGSSGYAI